MFVCKDAYKKGHGKVEHNNPIQKPDGKKYVYQIKSEISKNHQGMSSNQIEDINVRMYGSLCPVKSFEKYLQKRIQKRKALFQTPRMS